MNNRRRNYIVSFADSRMWRTIRRFRRQAEDMRVYDEIHVMDESSLSTPFRSRFAQRLVRGSRGFGYWVWKPQIVLQVLERMREGDVLQYTDAGCHLRPAGRKRLLEYFDMAASDRFGLLAFQNKPLRGGAVEASFSLPDAHWTKGDLLDHFNVRGRSDITATGTVGAGIFFLRKSPGTEAFIREWLAVYERDFSLVDDTPSRSMNLDGFIEHRHDQGVFSILCKMGGATTVSAFEYWYPSASDPRFADWAAIRDMPIWAMRDKDRGPTERIWRKARELASMIRRRVLHMGWRRPS